MLEQLRDSLQRLGMWQSFEADLAGQRILQLLAWVAAGVALLKDLGVQGAEDELKRLVEDVGGHALTLEALDFGDQADRVEHDAVADQALHPGLQDARPTKSTRD